MKTHPRQTSATHLFGLHAIWSFLQLSSEAETLKRIESGEIKCEMAGGTMPIMSKDAARALLASPHFMRHKKAA